MPRTDLATRLDLDRRFPVRVRIRLDEDRLGQRLADCHRWLGRHLGPGNFALAADDRAPQTTFHLYLPSVQAAHAFVVAQLDRD